jgi:hypothetical protein
MQSWKILRLLILAILLGGLAWTLYTRGLPGGFDAAPASLQTEYKTEHEWAIRESALDVEEMAAFADRRSPRPLPQMLPDVPWDADAFVPHAEASFGDAVAIVSSDVGFIDVYPALTSLDVPTLIESSKVVSQMLAANMRNPRAHESAALVIGAFALRDAADLFTDVRWALNRMTAHLAAAKALRVDDQRSPDGAIANVVLLVLANHHARALAELGTLGSGTPPEPMNAWVRAMHLRITQDWRTLPEPTNASRLEKLEYFRARRATVKRQRPSVLLSMVGEPIAADFMRIGQEGHLGVEDAHTFIGDGLEMELEEARSVYRRMHGRAMPESLSEALNHRAPRLISDGPQVLPWGAWAEFYQRHIAMNIGLTDNFLRHQLGAADSANEMKRTLEARLGQLTMFPIGTARWTKGSQGTEADLAHLREAIALSAQAPELIAVRAWKFFEMGSRYEPVPTHMPVAANWFTPPTAAVPFEAGIRHTEGFRSAQQFEPLLAAAPHDTLLLTAMAAGGGEDPGVTHARGLLAYHHDYDLRALESSVSFLPNEAERLPLRRKSCEISSRECLTLASSLLLMGDEAAAADLYGRALLDPEIDAVTRASSSYWPVTYFYRHQQIDKAIALAEDAMQTGAGYGYVTRGWLNEQRGMLDQAEKDHYDNATRYEDLSGLVAFYYRRVEVDRNAAYEAKWLKWRAEIFPNGLQPEPSNITGVPPTGVFVTKDSEYSRAAGIRAGDIIVGLDGWRVDNHEQYQAILVFKDDPTVKLTVSRGGRLVTIEAKSPTRRFGTYLETHPMKGWIKD